MDFSEVCSELSERYPQWGERVKMLELFNVPGVHPVDNDGRSILYNGRLMKYYTKESQCFYIAQQLLHLQLAHYARGSGRDRKVWKRASDAVVNGMLKADGFQVPEDAVLLPEAGEKSAEEVYAVLLAQAEQEQDAEGGAEAGQQQASPADSGKQAGKDSEGRPREIDDPGLAAAIAGLAEMLEPSMQQDFDWFPGSTIRDGMLRSEFRAYPVACAEILLDTSASIDTELLRTFVRGVKGLLRQDALIRVGCFDTRFYGFQEVRSQQDIFNLELTGAGGTDFNAAVAAFSGDAENRIVFTDGFAEMPAQRCDAVWVVYGNTTVDPPGGRVLYVRPEEEKEKHAIDFLIT